MDNSLTVSTENLPKTPAFKLQEMRDAQKACEHWKIAIVLSLLCGIVGTIFQVLACHKLYKARATLQSPVLAIVLAIVWPGIDIVNLALSVAGVDLPFGIGGWISVLRILLCFFVTQSIFIQWSSLNPSDELKRLVLRWERFTMFGQFPCAAIIAWITVVSSVEGWNLSDFQTSTIQSHEWIMGGIILVAMAALGICSIYYEYQTLAHFQKRTWGIFVVHREHERKQRKLEQQNQNAEEGTMIE